MSEREFENLWSDYSTKTASEYFENDKLKDLSKFRRFQNSTYEKNFKNFSGDSDDYSIYTGNGGIALLKFLLSTKTSDQEEAANYLMEARKLLTVNKLNKKRVTFVCGDSGILALAAVIEHKLGNEQISKTLIQQLLGFSARLDDFPFEVLYGLAGYLFSLLFVQKHIDDQIISKTVIQQVFNKIITQGKRESKELRVKSPLMYTWHEKQYLGAAHGLAGILYQLLLARNYDTSNEINTSIRGSIDFLLTLQFPSGNFPSSLGNTRDSLVQWCHGSPGFTHLFCEAYQVYKDEKYLKAALQCGEVVWKRGILSKGYSICHGASGNGYTFLKLYTTTKDNKHLYRAIKFAEWCTDYTSSHEFRYPDRPSSLFEGIAGSSFLRHLSPLLQSLLLNCLDLRNFEIDYGPSMNFKKWVGQVLQLIRRSLTQEN